VKKKKDTIPITIRSLEQIAEAFAAERERRFIVYEGTDCLSILERIKYVEDEITPEERERFDEHILTCLYCFRRIENLRRKKKKLEMPPSVRKSMLTSVGTQRLAAGGASVSYKGPDFEGEIYKDEGGYLILSLYTDCEDYIGKKVRVSVLSARRFSGAADSVINWVNGSPEDIISSYNITEHKTIEVAMGTTQLSSDNKEDFEQLEAIFKEIEIEVIAHGE
jgi:hypothetical protein